MNRKIKFRAWDKVKQIWCNYKIDDGTVYFMDNDTGCWYRNYPGKYENFDLMQYTGIKDINNVEIYEGDIVEISKEKSYLKDTAVVKFDKYSSSFVLVVQDDDCGYLSYDFLYCDRIFYKVIGNIYEHKDLLKQENK
jgi:hypothetical protein F3_00892